MRAWWEAVPGRVSRRAQPARPGRRLHRPVRPRRRAAAPARERPGVRAVAGAPAGPPRPPAASGSCSPAPRWPTAPERRRRRAWPRCCATWSAPRSRPGRRCGAIYSHTRGGELLDQIAPLGFVALEGEDPVRLGGGSLRPIVCDLGPESVAGWLSGMAARDLPGGDDRARRAGARAGARRPAHRAQRRSSATCCATCASARAGPSSARRSCARSGGTQWTGGSNVVDVAVSGLRRKLGERAGALQTVRGVGYRLQPL